MASQFHPELTSTLDKPSKMFYHFVATALQIAERAPASSSARDEKRPHIPVPSGAV
jgi:hypothetical protein